MRRHELFQVTAPANTPKTAPVEVLTNFAPGELLNVRLKIPRGHASLTGIQIALAHQQVIPNTAGAWILGDSDQHDFTLTEQPESGAWSVFVYNTDRRAHYWQVSFEVEDARRRAGNERTIPAPLAPARIYDAALRERVR